MQPRGFTACYSHTRILTAVLDLHIPLTRLTFSLYTIWNDRLLVSHERDSDQRI